MNEATILRTFSVLATGTSPSPALHVRETCAPNQVLIYTDDPAKGVTLSRDAFEALGELSRYSHYGNNVAYAADED